MKRLSILIPLIILLALAFVVEDADGRGRRPGGPPRGRPPGPGATGSGSGQGSAPEEPREAPSTPGAIDGEDSAEKGADTKERPKKAEDALRDEIALHAEKAMGECIARSANGLVRRAFRGAQKNANRKAGDCPVAEQPAKDPTPPVEKAKPKPEESQKSD